MMETKEITEDAYQPVIIHLQAGLAQMELETQVQFVVRYAAMDFWLEMRLVMIILLMMTMGVIILVEVLFLDLIVR